MASEFRQHVTHLFERTLLTELLFSIVWLLINVLSSSAQPEDPFQSNLDTKRLTCDVAQKGFHLNIRCQLLGVERSSWDGCVLKMRLSRSFYVDPYELAVRQPDVNFTLSKSKSGGNQSSVLGRWLSWFSGSGKSKDDIVPGLAEVPMNRSEVDVEAPSWMADSMTLSLYPKKVNAKGAPDSTALEIPLHIRYRLPRDDGESIDRTPLAHPSVQCDDGFEYNTWNSVPPFELPVPVPPTSDLLYVMPVTILLLTVGVIVLLIA